MTFNGRIEATMRGLIETGSRMTDKSNFVSFAKRVQRLPPRWQENVLYEIKDRRRNDPNPSVYNRIEKEVLEVQHPINNNNDPRKYKFIEEWSLYPRAAWYDAVHLSDGSRMIVIGNSVYTQEKNSSQWIRREHPNAKVRKTRTNNTNNKPTKKKNKTRKNKTNA